MSSPISAMSAVRWKLQEGHTVILDGGTGTELQSRGVSMDDQVWCGIATLSHGDVLMHIHQDYILAGADIITANTFSTNRNMLGPAGLGAKVAEINSKAVAIARRARDNAAAERPVLVAGSMSHQVPVLAGTDCRNPDHLPSAKQARENFSEMANLLAEAGVDLLLMEMMSDPELAVPAIEAALQTGLPVWVGLSYRHSDDNELVSFALPERSFAEIASEILAVGGEAAGVMHSNASLIGQALDSLGEFWDGPLMAYPDSGYFKMPNWQFDHIIPAQDFAGLAASWIADHGAQVVGGCCGLGVEHIAQLSRLLKH